MNKETTVGLMKISELAKATDTKVSTVKFYIKEGLIFAASKTSPNMAYYHPDCIARIQLIKSLQKDHYYPLSVIKHMLSISDRNQKEIELLDVIHKADNNSQNVTYTSSEISKMTTLSREEIEKLTDTGIIKPETAGKKKFYNELDLKVLLLVKRRLDAGIPFNETVESFKIYSELLEEAVRADVDAFITKALITYAPTTEQAVLMISVSDETLDQFTNLKRKEFNRTFGSERLEDLDRFASNLNLMLKFIGNLFLTLGYPKQSSNCLKTLATCPEETDIIFSALSFFYRVINSMEGNLSRGISIIGKAQAFFSSKNPEDAATAGDSLLLYSLKLSWMSLAPNLLGCAPEARKTRTLFTSFVKKYKNSETEGLVKRVVDELIRLGGDL